MAAIGGGGIAEGRYHLGDMVGPYGGAILIEGHVADVTILGQDDGVLFSRRLEDFSIGRVA